jgi:hypothetical protein
MYLIMRARTPAGTHLEDAMPSTISYQAAPSPAPGITRDSHTTLASLTTLSTINATLLLPGHGEPFTGTPADAATQARNGGIR